MKCAWTQLLSVLPQHIRSDVDRLSKDTLQELRLRLGKPAILITTKGNYKMCNSITAEDIHFVVNTASRYSPWSAATASQGYITAPGGHRIGLCGHCVTLDGEITGIRNVTGVCIRVAREFVGVAEGIPQRGSVLILGPPGSGKTTLLRDMIRIAGDRDAGSVAVVDERGELFPDKCNFCSGMHTDILTGCDKKNGVEMVLRTMGPARIAVDEITAEVDCNALVRAGWCGVDLMATAHAANLDDLRSRPVYRPLLQTDLFKTIVVLKPDKSWKLERMEL